MHPPLIYLDHAAATPVSERVLAAMVPYMTDYFFNPSSPYKQAVSVRRDYEQAKARLGKAIGVKGDEIILTAGATESINLLFNSISGHVVTSAIEHPSVLAAAIRDSATIVDVDHVTGIVSPEAIADAIRPDTMLVSIGLANSETGTVQPLKDIAQVIDRERNRRREAGIGLPLYFHTDASQGAGQIDITPNRLGVDAITLNASKVYGPKQVALLWTAPHVSLRPLIVGGGQENGLRSGTENVAGAIGFAVALEQAVASRHETARRLSEMRDSVELHILQEFSDAVVTGSRKRRLPGHLHISFPGLDAERLVFALEDEGVCVATGSACAANKGTRSHVLTALGVAPEVADGSLRLTFGMLNDGQQCEVAVRTIVNAVRREKERVEKI